MRPGRLVSSTAGRLAAFSSLVGVAQRFLQILATLLIMPLVMNSLGTSSFGIWAAAASLTWMASALDLGIGSALITEVARARAADDWASLRPLLNSALWIGAVLAVVEIVGASLFVPLFAPSEASDAYLIAATCMALNVPFSFGVALWTGSQRVYVAWVWEAAQSIASAFGMWLLTHLTTDLRFYVAVSAGGVLLTNCAGLTHFLIRHPELRPTGAPPSSALARQLLARGAPYLILGLGVVLTSYSDSVIALSLLGADAAAVMAVSQRLCVTAQGLLIVLTLPLWPAFANAAVLGEITWIKRHIGVASLLVGVAALSGSAVIILFGEKLIQIWLGGKIFIGPDLLWAIVIWIVIPSLGRIPDVLLNALGVVWFQVKVAVVFGVLALTFKLVVAGSWGVPGILAVTGIAYLFTHLPAYLWWVFKWMRDPKSSYP